MRIERPMEQQVEVILAEAKQKSNIYEEGMEAEIGCLYIYLSLTKSYDQKHDYHP